MTPLFQLQDIRLSRGDSFCLAIDSLALQRGGLYALQGANGAGKSTLLNLLALLLKPDHGQLIYHGQPVRWTQFNLVRLRRQITMVEQNPYLLSGSVFSNLDYGLRCHGVDPTFRPERIHAALECVGLAGFEDRDSRDLSQGEIQRVALARALVLEPDVLLLDEPTANCDERHRAVFAEQVANLHQKGVTVVFATHNIAQARQLNAEIVHLERGRIAGSSRQLLAAH